MCRFLFLTMIAVLPMSASAADLHFAPSCLPPQQTAISNAFATATQRSAFVYGEFRRPWSSIPPGQKIAYQTWFGPFDAQRSQRVIAVLDSIRSQLARPGVTYGIECMTPYDPNTGNGCRPGDYAELLPNQRFAQVITFCDGFFGAGAGGGYDNQWGIVIHEVTHTAANTEDHSYSTRHARNLPPNRAVDNADNYEYFFETLYN